MDLLDHSNQLIKVRIEELEIRLGAREIYIMYFGNYVWFLLTLSDQYYLSDESQRSIRFLKDVLLERKSNLSLTVVGI